jgi:PAS domain S-box-containing protein
MLQRAWPNWLSSWVGSFALTIVVGIIYYLSARLSLALLTERDGVAVFWPAAGVASGAMIALGRVWRWPVAIGVMAATIVANLLGDRNIASAIVFALCNAGEALIIAWLIESRFGPRFDLDSPQRVLGFFLVTGIGTAISGIGGAAGFILFHSSDVPILTTWLNWFASDALGIVTVAPVVIGLARSLHDPPNVSELGEGTLALGVLTLASAIGFGAPVDYWFTLSPIALVLPLLVWPAARCRPVFAAAAAFIVALAIVWAITFGIGRFGDLSIRLADRALAAQASLLAISACALGLAALFSERRHNEAALKDGNRRLQLALDCAELGTWSLQLKTGHFENDVRDRRIHGHGRKAPLQTLAQMRSQVHPDDLPDLDAAFLALGRAGGSCRTEYRLAPPASQAGSGRERWVAIEGAVVRQSDGKPVQLLGVTRDITDRKFAEQALADRNAQLALAGKIALVGSFAFDVRSETMQISPGYAAIHGLSEGTSETSRADWRARVHPDDIPRLDANLQRDVDGRRSEHYCEYRIVRSDGQVRWIEARSLILYDRDGVVQRIVGTNIDVTRRKKAELTLADRNMQLSLAAKIGLVGSYAYDADSEIMQISEGYAAIHGFPDNAGEVTRSECLAAVHPDDAGQAEQHQSEAFNRRWGEYSVEYRIIRPHSEIRWVETRCFISYDEVGEPRRVVGVTIDITERKRAEEHQRVLIAELDHRVKNVLATVSAVAGQTLESSKSMSHFVAALDGRIRSMAATHELLSTAQWRGMSLAELVRRELAPYAGGNNTKIDGPIVMLSAEAGQAMGMVIHELVTNAAKYGALSSPSGHVLVRWYRKLNGSAKLVVTWQECGGPKVECPKQAGYGTSVVRDLIPYEFGGTVEFAFADEGVRCRLEIPFDRVISDKQFDGVKGDGAMQDNPAAHERRRMEYPTPLELASLPARSMS